METMVSYSEKEDDHIHVLCTFNFNIPCNKQIYNDYFIVNLRIRF